MRSHTHPRGGGAGRWGENTTYTRRGYASSGSVGMSTETSATRSAPSWRRTLPFWVVRLKNRGWRAKAIGKAVTNVVRFSKCSAPDWKQTKYGPKTDREWTAPHLDFTCFWAGEGSGQHPACPSRGALPLWGARRTCPSQERPETDRGKGHTPLFRTTFVSALPTQGGGFKLNWCVWTN